MTVSKLEMKNEKFFFFSRVDSLPAGTELLKYILTGDIIAVIVVANRNASGLIKSHGTIRARSIGEYDI